MRNEYLSDFVGDSLREAQRFRIDARADLERCQDRTSEAVLELQLAQRRKPLWKRLLSVQSIEERAAAEQVEEAEWQEARARARWEKSKPDVDRTSAGVRGEVALVSRLAVLPDEWLSLRGYKNGRGETDVVLVGPGGVWAIEVKNLSRIRLRADGEAWFYDKLDSNGNIVGTYPAIDDGGRFWGRQVGEVAGELARWLAHNDYPIPVRTAVMLMDESSRILRCNNPGVDLLSVDPRKLLKVIEDRATPLDPGTCDAIAGLVRRDHRHHNS